MSDRGDPPTPPNRPDWSALLAAAERRGVRVWRYDKQRGHPVPVTREAEVDGSQVSEDVEEIR